MINSLARIRTTWRILQPRALAITLDRCPLCDARIQLRLAHRDIGVRCLACGASVITQSLVAQLRAHGLPQAQASCLELSARGVLVDWLARQACQLTTCTYDEALNGEVGTDGTRYEDVQSLSFADQSFDLCTSTEVFEHVADDAAGFAEVLRVLRPGGWFVFSVPIEGPHTIARTMQVDGIVVPLLTPSYHLDPAHGNAPVLVHRDYGVDIVQRLLSAGFSEARLGERRAGWFGFGRPVVLARRAA